jgi:hypothetical protein
MTGTNISHESGSERTCFGNPKSVASVFTGLVAFGGVPFRYGVDPPDMTVHSRQQLSSRPPRKRGERLVASILSVSFIVLWAQKGELGAIVPGFSGRVLQLASDCAQRRIGRTASTPSQVKWTHVGRGRYRGCYPGLGYLRSSAIDG